MPGIDSNTKLMLHCNGTDESTDFPDASDSDHTVTAENQAQVDTAEKKWGSASYIGNGVQSNLKLSNHNNWDIPTNWTVDFWVKFDVDKYNGYVITQFEDGDNRWVIRHLAGNGWQFYMNSGGGTILSLYYGTEITDINQHHVAIIKVGSLWGIYTGGNQSAYLSDADMDTFTGDLTIGSPYSGYSGSDTIDGHLDEIRIQHSNIFGANPNDTPNDTITVPTAEYARVVAPAETIFMGANF